MCAPHFHALKLIHFNSARLSMLGLLSHVCMNRLYLPCGSGAHLSPQHWGRRQRQVELWNWGHHGPHRETLSQETEQHHHTQTTTTTLNLESFTFIVSALKLLAQHFCRAFRVFLRFNVLLINYLNPSRLNHTPQNKNVMKPGHFFPS